MPRRLAASLLLVSAAFCAQAQESGLSDAADELRFMAQERPAETVRLRIDGSDREISFLVDERGRAIYQGDIVLGDAAEILALEEEGALTLQQLETRGLGLHGLVARNAAARWPEGKVPYFIDASVPSAWLPRIRDAIAHWEARTRIRFVALDAPEGDYILFYDDPGDDSCQSPIGRQAGPARVQLASWCKWGNVAHEIGHALGLHHEQARFDRDRFIKVEFGPAATETTRFQFRRDAVRYADFGPYCYDSIMHYPTTALGGVFTISALETPMGEATGDRGRIGQRAGLADCDVDTIHRYYGLDADGGADMPAGDMPMADMPAAEAMGTRFEGRLEFFPVGCEEKRRCFLKHRLRFSDPYGEVWQADSRDPNAPAGRQTGMTDGASIPRLAQPLIGPPFHPSYIRAAVIHDHYMYKENRVRSWWSVQRVFYDMLKDLGVSEAKAQIMYLGVLVGASKWIRLVPGRSCGPRCINDMAATLPQVEIVDGDAYREWAETYDTPEYEAAMQRGIAELLARGERMTLGDVNLLARDLLDGHPVFTQGDTYSPAGAQDAVIAE